MGVIKGDGDLPADGKDAATAAERARCASIAEGWLAKFGSFEPKHVSPQKWANDAVKDIADAIRRGCPGI